MACYANTILYIYKINFLDLVPKLFSISIYPRNLFINSSFLLKTPIFLSFYLEITLR